MKSKKANLVITLIVCAAAVAFVWGSARLSGSFPADIESTASAESGDLPDPAPAENAAALPEGTPDFEVTDAQGNPVKLSDSLDMPVVVNFWATWCGPCRSELPRFDKLAAEYDGKITFMMVDLTDGLQETREGVEAFIAKAGFTFPVYYDDTFSASLAYEVYSIPLTVFIDAEGNIVDTFLGAMTEKTLREYLDKLI